MCQCDTMLLTFPLPGGTSRETAPETRKYFARLLESSNYTLLSLIDVLSTCTLMAIWVELDTDLLFL